MQTRLMRRVAPELFKRGDEARIKDVEYQEQHHQDGVGHRNCMLLCALVHHRSATRLPGFPKTSATSAPTTPPTPTQASNSCSTVNLQ